MKVTVEWDPVKAEINLKKHQVSFEEASTVLDDPLFITFLDVEHSDDEERYITLGLSQRNRVLLIAHTDREGSNPHYQRQKGDEKKNWSEDTRNALPGRIAPCVCEGFRIHLPAPLF